MSSSRWIQGVRAGLPLGMPGMGDEMDGAMQQAPQLGRHFMVGGLSLVVLFDDSLFFWLGFCCFYLM